MNALRKILVSAATVFLICAAASAQDNQRLGFSLKRPTGATSVPNAQGFIQRWMLLEPIKGGDQTENAVRAAINTNVFEGQLTVLPKEGDKVTANDGKEHTWHAVETERYNVDLYQFGRFCGTGSSSSLFWAVTIVDSPEEVKDARLAVGSNAASIWWVNGQEVVGIFGDRQTLIDDGVSKRLTLRKGQNVIRVAVDNAGGASGFCARLLDSNDQPIKNLTVCLPK